jgi:hypothetical protein
MMIEMEKVMQNINIIMYYCCPELKSQRLRIIYDFILFKTRYIKLYLILDEEEYELNFCPFCGQKILIS